MNNVPFPMTEVADEKRISECREIVEGVFTRILDEAAAKGWGRAEIAMTFADVAEDYVMELAALKRVMH
jgi:hypothetical protein